MNVIVFASRKGGSGKSTLAAHLAAHVHKTTKPCLLIDADPQGSLTLWHKLRGTNEPPIKTAVNSVGGIVAGAKRDGFEWVFIDTPPNLSAVVEDSIRNATMVSFRPDLGYLTSTRCRKQFKPAAPGASLMQLCSTELRPAETKRRAPSSLSPVNRWPSSVRRCGAARSPTEPIS